MLNMENKKQLMVLLMSVILGIIAVIFTGQYVSSTINSQVSAIAKQTRKDNALLQKDLGVMKQELRRMKQSQDRLSQEQKKLKRQPAVVISDTKKKAVKDKAQIFSMKTPYGKRAITIMIDSLSAVGGLIVPGDVVDILAHFDLPAEQNGKAKKVKTTAVMFQNIEVLAVGVNYDMKNVQAVPYAAQQKSRALNVTVAVTPEEAGLLTFVKDRGKLQLILRSPQEKSTQILEVASWQSLADYVLDKQGTDLKLPKQKKEDVEEEPEEEPEEAPIPNIQIFKGGREVGGR